MNKRIIYKNSDGTLAIIIPADECNLTIEQIAAKDVPAGVSYSIVDVSEIPVDRSFRSAWEHSNNGVTVSLPKAKAIHLDRLRALRVPKLAALDIAYQRADEEGNVQAKKDISSKKKALRDVTSIALPDDLDALKNFIPDILK